MRAFDPEHRHDTGALLPPLAESIVRADILEGSRVVVLIVIDGYGSRIGSGGSALREAVPGTLRVTSELTSVFPSTTAAALTTLQTGAAPGQHGIAGYTLYLPDARRVVNMVQFAAVDGSTLPSRVADPATMLTVHTVYEQLAVYGIESVVVSHLEYAQSPMTKLHSGETTYLGHRTAAEFALMLLREARRPGRRFVFGYWAGVDMLGHTYGPLSAEVSLETQLIEHSLIDGLLRPLNADADDVAVILTADHGMAALREDEAEPLGALSKKAGRFTRPPTGERRAVGLFTSGSDHRSALAEALRGRGVVVDSNEAAAAGLFGPVPHHGELLARIGDTLLLARGSHSFPFRPKNEHGSFSLGAHGSMTFEEMLVPLLIWRYGR